VGYSRERRRSSSSRGGAAMGHYEQREDLMVGTVKPGGGAGDSASAGLSRTLSLSQDKKPARSKYCFRFALFSFVDCKNGDAMMC
jgi:hypothetical protein